VSTLTRSFAVAPPRRRPSPWAGALTAYPAVAAALWAIVATSTRRLAAPPLPRGLGWLDGWVRYDSGWYHLIATAGYSYTPGKQSPVAFFPAYPLAMRGLGHLVGNVYVAGVVITVAAGLAAALLFAGWSAQRLPRSVAGGAVALLVLYPYAFYLYGTVYADALFVAASIGAFVLLERNRPWVAGGVGALATAGRPIGIAVLVGLTVRAVELAALRPAVELAAQRPAPTDPAPTVAAVPAGEAPARTAPAGAHRMALAHRGARVRAALTTVGWRDAGVLLSAAGLLGYCGYQWVRFGTPLAFVEAESAPGWDQGTGLLVWFKVAFVRELVQSRNLGKLRLLAAAMACVVVVLLLPRIRRRFGWGYAVFTAVVVAIPVLSTKDFMGSGRYVLAAFPAFAAAADFLAERPQWVLRTLLVLFAVGLATTMVLYTRDYEVS
jgi:hypothetical protein